MAHGPDTQELLTRFENYENNTLNLHDLNVHSFPELPHDLKILYCYRSHITSLPKLPDTLEKLDVNETPLLTSLPELPASLKGLWCSSNGITSLPTLPASLQRLFCCDIQIHSLPQLPPSLTYLYCHNTLLTYLPELPIGLKFLDCNNTFITSLPQLPESLLDLYCYQTQITTLPELPTNLRSLYCVNTPLVLQRKDEESIADYNLRWRAWREEQASKKRIQEKNRLLKEEIVMEAWKPERFEKWLEAGYDPDD
jgi:hypothetical protein